MVIVGSAAGEADGAEDGADSGDTIASKGRSFVVVNEKTSTANNIPINNPTPIKNRNSKIDWIRLSSNFEQNVSRDASTSIASGPFANENAIDTSRNDIRGVDVAADARVRGALVVVIPS